MDWYSQQRSGTSSKMNDDARTQRSDELENMNKENSEAERWVAMLLNPPPPASLLVRETATDTQRTKYDIQLGESHLSVIYSVGCYNT